MIDSCSNRVLYKGILFHSLLEAQWASFFDTASISYQYRPARFNLSRGLDLWYEPQFFWLTISGLKRFRDWLVPSCA